MRHSVLLVVCLFVAVGCADPGTGILPPEHRRALADTVATLFDSLSAIHRDHPDTGLRAADHRGLAERPGLDHPGVSRLMTSAASSAGEATGKDARRRPLEPTGQASSSGAT